MRTGKPHGVTLVELLAVLAIVGVLLSVGVYAYRASRRGVALAAARGETLILKQAIEKYRDLYGFWPVGEGNAALVRSLRARYRRDPVLEPLKERQQDAEGNWLDPWGRPYAVEILDPDAWQAAEAAVAAGAATVQQRYWVEVVRGPVNVYSLGPNGTDERGFDASDASNDLPLYPSGAAAHEVDDLRAGER